VIATTRVAPRDLMLEQPAVQRRLNLDEGLPSPHAENVLREMDADGSLGIKDAPAEVLADAAKCTRGFPPALEALVAILNADRNTTLPELLAASERLPANVVDALVGEAFNRLDALAQEVMQALAIYGGPVPAVAVDYLLQPFEPTIDSAPVLGRLVNMQFARRDAARYYLHQVDRDYALSRMGVGEPSDRHLDPPPFTQFALDGRAADYFEQTRTPRESWETLDDLAPQRAEFDLRCQAGDYDTAAEILLDISYDYLQTWGYSRLARDLHECLQGHITDPSTAAQCAGDLGLCYYNLGDVRRAVELHTEAIAQARAIADLWGESVNLGLLANDYWVLADVDRAIELRNEALEIAREVGDRPSESNHLGGLGICYAQGRDIARSMALYEQALEIAREVGDRKGEAVHLGNLGIEYERLGYVRQAIAMQDQALAIDRDSGNREGEAYDLNNLGSCYAALGQFERAIELHDTALTIAREIGDRRCEGLALGFLADKRRELGQTEQAIELYEQARAITVDIGDRGNEASALGDLGRAHGALGDWPRAVEYGEAAVRMADEIGFELAAAELRRRLARLYLLAGRVDAARATAQSALDRDYGPARADLMLLHGIAHMRLRDVEAAREALLDALEGADAQLLKTADAYDTLDRRALALSGLSLAGGPERLGEAEATFRSARAIASAAGTVAGVLGLFDALAACDETGLLGPVRFVAAGDG
jgi:tetratricopeptide (TPR) repeat protein